MLNGNRIERNDTHSFLFKLTPFKYNDMTFSSTIEEEKLIGQVVRECMRRGVTVSFKPNGDFFECTVDGDDAAIAAAIETGGFKLKGTTKILGTDRGNLDSMSLLNPIG
jgi:hypothetical protein